MKQSLLTVAIVLISTSALLAQDKKVVDTTAKKPHQAIVIDRPDSVYVPQLGKKIKVNYDDGPKESPDMMRRHPPRHHTDLINVPEK